MLKKITLFGFLFISIIGFSQFERYIEVVVSDTAKLKVLNYTFVITSGMSNSDALVDYLGDGEEVVEPDKSMFQFATILKQEQFDFILEESYSKPLSFFNSDSAIVVSLKNGDELARIEEFVNEEINFKGAVKETFYESISLYEKKVYKNLYTKAEKKAKLIASYSGGSIGDLLSASENFPNAGGLGGLYKEFMKLGALGGFQNNDSKEKIEVVKMIFRFELK